MNIVALSTAYGTGAIAIVRLSGKEAVKLASHLTPAPLKPRFAHLRKLYFEGALLDEAIVIYFAAPNSFTGEDIVEFHTHGGVGVANAIIDALLKLGARAARAGEFSKRAVINGKMSLEKAESLAGLIEAKTQAAAKILARTLEGSLGEFCASLREELVKILAYTEVCIDYAEEDLPEDVLQNALVFLQNAASKIAQIVKFSQQQMGAVNGFNIALIGRPNVGKSSILNALLGKNRAIVSPEAGTTRDSVEEGLTLGTSRVKIIDTAGIREASGVEACGIERSFEVAKKADVVVCVFDASQPALAEDLRILSLAKSFGADLSGALSQKLESNSVLTDGEAAQNGETTQDDKMAQSGEKKVIFVLNKSDLARQFELPLNAISLCAKEGVAPLTEALSEAVKVAELHEVMLTTNRQVSLCVRAQEALSRSYTNLKNGELELFAFELHLALKAVGEVTQPPQNEEILDAMFGEFCLGK